MNSLANFEDLAKRRPELIHGRQTLMALLQWSTETLSSRLSQRILSSVALSWWSSSSAFPFKVAFYATGLDKTD